MYIVCLRTPSGQWNVSLAQGQSLESIECLFDKPWIKRVNIIYYIRYITSAGQLEDLRVMSS